MSTPQEKPNIEKLLEDFRKSHKTLPRRTHITPKVQSLTLKEMLSKAAAHASLLTFPPANFNPGRNQYTDNVISMSVAEAEAIERSYDSKFTLLKEYVTDIIQPIIEHCNEPSIRTAAAFGLPNWKYEYPKPISVGKQLLYNFFNYEDERFWLWTLMIGGISALWYSINVVAKTTVNIAKFFTEFLPLTLYNLTDSLANTALNKTRDEQNLSFNKVVLFAAYGIAKSASVAFKLIQFVGRAITSPPEGVMAAAREGWELGGSGITGAIAASVFATTSILISAAVFIVLFPLKSAFSYDTTVLPIINQCPPIVVHAFNSAVNFVNPAFNALGKILAPIFYPVVAPVSRLIHEPLSKAVIGMGSYAGGLFLMIDMTFTLYGVKLIKNTAAGIFGLGKKLFNKIFNSDEAEKKIPTITQEATAVNNNVSSGYVVGTSARTTRTFMHVNAQKTNNVQQANRPASPTKHGENPSTLFAGQYGEIAGVALDNNTPVSVRGPAV